MKKLLLTLLSTLVIITQGQTTEPDIIVSDVNVSKFQLTKEQESIILPILSTMKTDKEKVKSNSTLSPVQKLEAIKAIEKTGQSQILAFLTPAQKNSQTISPNTRKILEEATKARTAILSDSKLTPQQKNSEIVKLQEATTKRLQESK